MKREDDILKKIGRESGYKVPEGYFEQFVSRMNAELPERKLPEPVHPSLWQRLKPYVYMAAMFAGIWLMVKVFVAPQAEKATVMAENTTLEEVEDDAIDDYMMASIDEYTIFETLFADSQ